ncbi:MAG TPA: squalene--hopene cyclase [Pirellulales bacterium]|jgi:hypothetical protein|nr:squalene--hopene cyclase [Pirellulales bacterium]
MRMQWPVIWCLILTLVWGQSVAFAEGDWEITPQSEEALNRGLQWLATNQGPDGNWDSNDLGLVSMGALAFLAAGHTPGHGKYGQTVEKALSYVIRNAKPSGLLNISDPQRDMYNHGLSTFVLGQAYGVTNDQRLNQVLDRALKLIFQSQCRDGGWDYRAQPQDPARGHDLSLAVMQAKAIRSAVDSGLEVPPEVIQIAIKSVRDKYTAASGKNQNEAAQKEGPGQFSYTLGGQSTAAMAAAGVVCLQEFGQYDDWRIPKSMAVVRRDVEAKKNDKPSGGKLPFDAYTLYYIGQALYQVGGQDWKDCYPILRDQIVAGQLHEPKQSNRDGLWNGAKVGGKPDELYGTAVACFVLAIPNRYLPILQEGKIDSLKAKFQEK